MIIPQQSLHLIRETLDCVDVYKVGKLNNYKGLDKLVDWTSFLAEAVKTLRVAQKPFYIKEDLRRAAPSVALSEKEISPDLYAIK